jgi:hypothetical protein
VKARERLGGKKMKENFDNLRTTTTTTTAFLYIIVNIPNQKVDDAMHGIPYNTFG